MGTKTKYSFNIALQMCECLSNGDKFKQVIEDQNIARSTFFKWKRENKEFSDLYVNVAQDKGELCIEEIDQTMQDLKDGIIDPSTANVLIQTLKWKASKFYPKMYGDKLDLSIETVKPIEFMNVSKQFPNKK